MKKYLIIVSFSIALTLSNVSAVAQNAVQYQAEGSLVYLVGENQTPKFTREFQLTVSNSDWDIRVEPDKTSLDEGKYIDYFDVVHLGHSIYYYTSMGKLPPNAGVANRGTAVINNGDVPLEKGSFSSFIWLGLASSYYFQGSTNGEIQPIWSGPDIINTKVKAQWELFDTPPFLPKGVVYYRKVSGMPPAFENGWKAAELRVLSETNIGNLTFPLEFSYKQFRPNKDAVKVDDLETQLEVKVVVQSIILLSTAISPPLTHGTTLIEDGRFSKHPELTVEYASTNSRLADVPLNTVIAQHEKLASISDEKSQEPISNWKVKIFVLSFFILSAAAFVTIVLMKTKQKNN